MDVYVVQYLAPLPRDCVVVGVYRTREVAYQVGQDEYKKRKKVTTTPPWTIEQKGAQLGTDIRVTKMTVQV